jgi:hypothetical protein
MSQGRIASADCCLIAIHPYFTGQQFQIGFAQALFLVQQLSAWYLGKSLELARLDVRQLLLPSIYPAISISKSRMGGHLAKRESSEKR